MASLGTYNAVLTKLPQVFRQNLEKRPFKLHKNPKRQLFSSKCSCGEIECSFDKPADFFSTKVQKFLAHHPKTKKKKFFSFHSLNDSSGHLQGSFDRVAPSNWLEVQNFSAENPKINRKFLEFLSANYSCERVEFNFHKQAAVFLPTAQKYQLKN